MPVGLSNPPVRRVRLGAVFAVVCAAVVTSNLDLFVVNVALPTIGRSFHGTSLSPLSWVLNAYAIVFAAALVPAGWLADRTSYRASFLLGLAVFTLASGLCAISPAIGWLIAFRVLQAIGAAALMPTSLALLLTASPPQLRGKMVRAWAASAGVAAALGPVVGGLLVQANWRWVFIINLPIGVTALLFGWRVLPRAKAADTGPMPDLIGAVLLIAAVAAAALALVRVDNWGWVSARFLGAAAAALVLSALFVLSSMRHPAPVVEMSLLRRGAFAWATLAATLFAIAFAMMLLSAVLWCQQVWGYSALRTGLAVAPGPVMVPFLAFAAGPLGKRIGGGRVIALGSLVFAVGGVWWATRMGAHSSYGSEMLPGMLLTGIGVGLALPSLVSAAVSALPPQRFAIGSAVNTMARQIGAALGIALLVTILGTTAAADPVTRFQHGWLAMGIVSLLAAGVALRIGTRAAGGARVEKPAKVQPGQLS